MTCLFDASIKVHDSDTMAEDGGVKGIQQVQQLKCTHMLVVASTTSQEEQNLVRT
jgi:hypothetical protein